MKTLLRHEKRQIVEIARRIAGADGLGPAGIGRDKSPQEQYNNNDDLSHNVTTSPFRVLDLRRLYQRSSSRSKLLVPRLNPELDLFET